LAHSRSALKRLRQSQEARIRNRSTKARTRTLLTRALFSVDAEPGVSEAAVREAVSALDRAAQKGVIHANAAARSKSRLLKRYNQVTANAVASAAAAGTTDEAPAPRRRTTRPASDKPASDKGTTRRPRKT
jgi:small subunit ribosomal protein S20